MSCNRTYRKSFIIYNIAKFFILFIFARYSVIPKYLFFKKFFFEIGPLIRAYAFLFFNKLLAIIKHSFIYLFDLSVILSKIFLKLKSTSIILITFFFLNFILIIFYLFL